jgi:MFS family permease
MANLSLFTQRQSLLFHQSRAQGLPIGWLVDRKNRTAILTAGIAAWSVMTAACGLAKSFGALFLVRVGVGIGETTVAPCAFSLTADYFPKGTRPRAIALFSIGAPVGAGASYVRRPAV